MITEQQSIIVKGTVKFPTSAVTTAHETRYAVSGWAQRSALTLVLLSPLSSWTGSW